VPIIVEKCVKYFDSTKAAQTEGIFRMSPSAAKLGELAKAFDMGISVNLKRVQDAHLIAGLLKKYFRDLPEPLFTFELYSCFIVSFKIK